MSFYTVDNQHKADFFASLTVDDVTAALATEADPNEQDEKNVAPLHWIASGNEEPAVVAHCSLPVRICTPVMQTGGPRFIG